MFYSDDAIQEAACSSSSGGGGVNNRSSSSCSCRPRGGPLSVIFSSFFNCWLPGLHDSSRSSLESKASWAKITRADALLELSKRQQSALMDKQEAIELLERKLQQLQSESMKPPELLQLQQAGKQSLSKLLTQGIADDDHHQKLPLHNFEIPDSTTASSDQTSTSSSSSYRFPESTSTEDHSPQAAAAAAIRRAQQEATAAAAAAASSCISSVNTKEASAKESISSSVQEDEDQETKEFSAEERSPSQEDHETKAFSAKERSSRSSSQEEDHLESRAFSTKERSSRSSLQEDRQETKAFSSVEKSSRRSLQEDQQVPKTFSAKEKSSRDSLQKEDEEIKAFSAKERSSRSLLQEDAEETTKAFSAMERSSRSWLQEDSAGREVQNAAGAAADRQVLQIPTWNPSAGLECINLTEKEHLFEMGVMRARVAVRYFCKLFMKQMEISGYSVWRTLQALDPDATFAKQEHTAYALESNLNKAMYHCFENDSFDDLGLTLIIDPSKRCKARFEEFQRMRLVDATDAANLKHQDFEPRFLAFCERKMREMWFLFPWNIVFKHSDERKLFTGAFLDAAKCIWLLHCLAFSFHPAANILRVGKGMPINPRHIETIVPLAIPCEKCGNVAKVQFMTVPGFQLNQSVIRCQVYQHLQCP
ncbi:hypothetical protein BDL97_07G032300 [Sphagnum fallax]|nr:hypothetical protein BDL97_07G032300 [Sphagnum fallax]